MAAYSSPLPSGSDGGHMLAFSRWFLGDTLHAPWTYAPLVPALFGLLSAASLGSVPAFALMAKAATAASFLACAALFASAQRALGAPPREQRAAFVLAVANPLLVFVTLWGDVAQVLGFGLASLAAASLARLLADGHRPAALAFCASIILLAYTHWYSLAFAAAACLTILAFSLRRVAWHDAWRRVRAPLAVALACSLPMAWAFLFRTRPLLKDWQGGLGWHDARRMLEALVPSPMHVAVLVAWGAALAWLAARARPASPTARLALAGHVGGAVGLLVVTPPDLVDRVVFFAMLPLVAYAAHAWAHHPARRRHVASALVAVAAGTVLLSFVADAAYFSPLREPSLDAIGVLAAAPGAVLVGSPTPNIDAWWIEGLAARQAATYDDPRFYSLRSEVAAAHVARLALLGSHAYVGPPNTLVAAPSGSLHALHTASDAWPEAFRLTAPAHGLPAAAAEADGLRFTWPPEVRALVLRAPEGGWFEVLRQGDGWIEVTAQWLRHPGASLQYRLSGPWQATLSADGREALLAFGQAATVHVAAGGIPFQAEAVRTEELARTLGIESVYLRASPDASARFRHDPCAQPVFRAADVEVLAWPAC